MQVCRGRGGIHPRLGAAERWGAEAGPSQGNPEGERWGSLKISFEMKVRGGAGVGMVEG